MAHGEDQARWRDSFLQTLQIVGKAAARLPFGVPDPVLCRRSAVDLYTGGLWAAPEVELLATDPRFMRAELMALGFRCTERPPHGEKGLWHPGLQFGVSVSTSRDTVYSSAQENSLTVVLDAGRDSPCGSATISLPVIGIEDLIADQITDSMEQGAPKGEAATLIRVLVGLGWAGAGGRFRACYLQRRLVCETQGEVTLEPLPPTSGFDEVGPRTMRLGAMAGVIGAWRTRHGLRSDLSGLFNVPPPKSNRSDSSTGARSERAYEGGQAYIGTAQIIPFRTPPPRLPI